MKSPQILINNNCVSNDINLHLLPVNIQHNGNAKVSKYFKIEEDPELLLNGKPTLRAKFRGRQFRGAVQEIPEGYNGYLLREEEHQRDAQEKDEHNNKNWNNVGKFSQFTYWMREDVPSQGDSIQRCLNWLPLAAAIHSPLTKEILSQPVLYGLDDTNLKEKHIDTSSKRKVDQDDNALEKINQLDSSTKKRKVEEEEAKK